MRVVFYWFVLVFLMKSLITLIFFRQNLLTHEDPITSSINVLKRKFSTSRSSDSEHSLRKLHVLNSGFFKRLTTSRQYPTEQYFYIYKIYKMKIWVARTLETELKTTLVVIHSLNLYLKNYINFFSLGHSKFGGFKKSLI